jgi:hypothetical protein
MRLAAPTQRASFASNTLLNREVEMIFEKYISDDSFVRLHFDLRRPVSVLGYDIWVGHSPRCLNVRNVARNDFLNLVAALQFAKGTELYLLWSFVDENFDTFRAAVEEWTADAP